MKKPAMKLVSIKLPTAYIDGLNQLVERGIYPSRSEAIRVAVRDMLKKELWSRERVTEGKRKR
ncbi:MAG: ribbon-helix-helix domain-containing protein [Candidatus Freyrarchaeum guaymaensis]|nr:ribbon-helix-helix domain-containing protein [Candidatus Sigynarchaeota archaeon]